MIVRSRLLLGAVMAAALTSSPGTALAGGPMPDEARGSVSSALGKHDAEFAARAGHGGASVLVSRAQRITGRFTRRDALVRGRGGSVSLALRAIGRGTALAPVSRAMPRARSNRVTYGHRGVSEWFANGPLGIQQGFTLADRPSGDGWLTLALGASGSLRPTADGGAIAYRGAQGRVVLRYGGLTALDARNRPLPARLAVSRGRVVIRVDDSGARYPLRIDPLVSDGATLTQNTHTSDDEFGYDIAAAADTVVVGARYADGGRGLVYVFTKPAGGWAGELHETAVFNDDNWGSGDASRAGHLGTSVDISDSGKTIAAGAPDLTSFAGGALRWRKPSGGWTSAITPERMFAYETFTWRGGSEVAVAPDDSFVASAYPTGDHVGDGLSGGNGLIAIFDGANTPSPTRVVATGGSSSGVDSLAIVGHTIFFGDFNYQGTGGVFGFTRPANGNWATYVPTVPGTGPAGANGYDTLMTVGTPGDADYFGQSLAGDGDTLVVGAPRTDLPGATWAGAAYVYTEPVDGWFGTLPPSADLTASDPTANAFLGHTVAAWGSQVAASAPFEDIGANADQGAIYLYDRPAAGWRGTLTESTRVTLAGGVASDKLGGRDIGRTELGMDGSNLYVGMPQRALVQTLATRRTVTVARAGAGTGAVSGGPIDCSAATTACSATAKAYEDVELTATPAAGSLFTGWSGACSGTAPCTLPAGISAAAVTATFGLPARTLTVTTAGSGQVTATGVACPGDCSETYASGTVVTLTAAPAAGWRFTGWSGGGCGTAASCDVTLDADKATEATFTAIPSYALSVALGGFGSGTVKGTGIDCPGTCAGSYAEGSSVTLTATPAAGSSFGGWSGDCSGTGACTVTLSRASAVTATFALDFLAPVDVTPPPNHGAPSPNHRGSLPAATGAPGTVIRAVKLRSRQARFEFRAIGKATAFRCALAKGQQKKAPKLAPCRSPRAFSRLQARRYTFFVAAVGPGGTDKTPARRSFTIRR
jgi:hypothetical protein